MVSTDLQNLATARLARETAVDTLRTRMRGLINELATLLPDEDARCYTFGLSAPGDPETPGTPAAPTLTPVATVTESDATLSSLPIGVPLEFQITAVNDAGESVPSLVSMVTLA